MLHNRFFSILSAPPFDSFTSHRLVTSGSVNEVTGTIHSFRFSRGCPDCKRNVSTTSRRLNDPIFAVVDVSSVQLQSCNLSVSYSRRVQCADANRSGICLVMLAVS
jgi:hypothetical protein